MSAKNIASGAIKVIKNTSLLSNNRSAIKLTPTAVRRAQEILKNSSDCIGLKIGVKQKGCNGFSYTLDYATKKEKLDEEVNQDGIKIFIDRKAQLTLLGTEMDFVEDEISSGFVFYNPNIKGTCGCGESFNI